MIEYLLCVYKLEKHMGGLLILKAGSKVRKELMVDYEIFGQEEAKEKANEMMMVTQTGGMEI